MKEHNHMLWMMLACTVPLLVILLLPLLGITGKYNALIFVIVMFAAHIWMMKGHNHKSSGKKGDEKHEH